jgi:hypothetical protein
VGTLGNAVKPVNSGHMSCEQLRCGNLKVKWDFDEVGGIVFVYIKYIDRGQSAVKKIAL